MRANTTPSRKSTARRPSCRVAMIRADRGARARPGRRTARAAARRTAAPARARCAAGRRSPACRRSWGTPANRSACSVRRRGDDLAGAGEHVHLEHRLVRQAVAERRRLDAQPGDRAAEGDRLELRHDQRASARAAASRRPGSRRCTCPATSAVRPVGSTSSTPVRPETSRPGPARGAAPEQVRGPLGQPHR